ncbi:MAG: hypothetical protein Q9163_000737 [Psora crenata]
MVSPWHIFPVASLSRFLNRWLKLVLIALTLFITISLLTCFPLRLYSPTSTASLASSRSPYAYVTLLAQHPDLDNKTVPDDQDEYYLAVRTLAYQLLHAPETRTIASIPFVVLATKDIPQHKVDRLRKDGARVEIVEGIHADWLVPGLSRWRDMMCKLWMFELVEYEKVLFLDADMFIAKRIDGIFTDPATGPLSVNHNLAKHDEGPLPDTYLMAAQAYMEGRSHPYPPPKTDHFSGGFLLAKPSLKMLDYYLSLLEIEGRFRADAMEQDLLNYAHRRDGPMPWSDVTYIWTTTWPSMKEYEMGAHSLHEKWWDESIVLDLRLRSLWYVARGEMKGYYNALEGA